MGLQVLCMLVGGQPGTAIAESKQALLSVVRGAGRIWENVTGRVDRQNVVDAHWDLLCSREAMD